MNDTLSRKSSIDALNSHYTNLCRAVDLQFRSLARAGHNVTVMDAAPATRDHSVDLTIQYDTGERCTINSRELLPDGDDGSSIVYQVALLERLALELAAVSRSLGCMHDSSKVLASPPIPA